MTCLTFVWGYLSAGAGKTAHATVTKRAKVFFYRRRTCCSTRKLKFINSNLIGLIRQSQAKLSQIWCCFVALLAIFPQCCLSSALSRLASAISELSVFQMVLF
jgi:hypothetical protein